MKLCLQCNHEASREGWTCERCSSGPAIIDGYPAFAPALASANTNYSSDYFGILSEVDRRHFWFRARGAMVTWAMKRHFDPPRSVMEIGCGVGGMLSHIQTAFPQARITGSDIYTAALSYAATRVSNATLIQMDATAIPFASEFDLIAACDVIEHIERDDLALAAMHRALRPAGGIVLTVPQNPALWSAWDDLSMHQRRYTREELLRKVRAAGFTVERITSMSSLIYPLLRIARWRYEHGAPCDACDELHVAAPINFVLARVMAVERFLLRSGMDFGFGGSLLLVARRS